MLHSVRFLQSRWNARSPELSLKDLVEFIRPMPSALVQRARRHCQTCRLHCFVQGIAVAVDGPLPNSGVVLLGSDADPDHLVGSVRPCLQIATSELVPAEHAARISDVVEALAAGLLVYIRVSPGQSAFTEQVLEASRQHKRPVLDLVVGSDQSTNSAPLALREVRLNVCPRAVSQATPAVH